MKRTSGGLGVLSAVCVVACGPAEEGASDGIRSTEQAIHYSSIATNGEQPWMALIQYQGVLRCGGALLNKRWVITAASCLQGTTVPLLSVTLGEYDRSVSEGTEQAFGIANAVLRPGFVSETATAPPKNDLMLLKLNADATFNQWVAPIALPDGAPPFSPATLSFTGWGESGSVGATLRRGTTEIVDTCRWKGSTIWIPSLFCGVSTEPSAGKGDGGDPLVQSILGTKRLLGVLSADDDMEDQEPVFTRVDDYLPWIKEKTSSPVTPAFSCQGQTIREATPWISAGTDRIETTVDTSQCGFSATPEYFAALDGSTNHYKATGVTTIRSATPTSFSVIVFRAAITAAQANAANWRVNWQAAPENQTDAHFCTGKTSPTAWIDVGAGMVSTKVTTSACGNTATPRYFTSLSGVPGTANIYGANSIYGPTPTEFTVFLKETGLTAALAQSRGYYLNWAATPPTPQTNVDQCTGSTVPGSAGWQVLDAQNIFRDIDTTACGHAMTPLYLTSLGGRAHHYRMAGFTSIYSATRTGFRGYIYDPAGITPASAASDALSINWAAYP